MIDYIQADNSYSLMVDGKVLSIVPNRYPVALVELVNFVKETRDNSISMEANNEVTKLRQRKNNIKELSLVTKYNEYFTRTPYEHQRKAVEILCNSDRKALLFEQGMGKTYIASMAIQLLTLEHSGTKAVVVCPKIVFESWYRELTTWTKLSVVRYLGDAFSRCEAMKQIKAGEYDVVLTTFDMLTIRGDTDKKIVFAGDKATKKDIKNVVVTGTILDATLFDYVCTSSAIDILCIDEASRVISNKSDRSKNVLAMSKMVNKVWLLSGTLCVGRPTDLYMPMRLLDDSILGSNWFKFLNKYTTCSPWNKHIITGYKNVDVLKDRIKPYVLEKKRADCLDMPDRVFVERYYSISDEQRKLYDTIIDADVIQCTKSNERLICRIAAVKIIKMMQVLSGFLGVNDNKFEVCNNCDRVFYCLDHGIYPYSRDCTSNMERLPSKILTMPTSPKLETLREDLLDIDGKVIIWAWYRHDISEIENLLQRLKIKYITPSTTKCEEAFETDDSARVFLGQTMQGIGITLNSAKTTIYYSHGCALEPRLQSMDRNYRIGQKNDVTVIDYIHKGSVEESVVSLLKEKKDIMSLIQSNEACVNCSVKDCKCDLYGPGCKYENGTVIKQGLLWKNYLQGKQIENHGTGVFAI